MKKIILFLAIFLFLASAGVASAHRPVIVYTAQGNVQVNNPEISQAFFDELKGSPRVYFINSDKSFELYLNLLVPEIENRNGRYSANIFLEGKNSETKIGELAGNASEWIEYYEEFGRDYYLKGPELTKNVEAGKYRIEVYSADNLGKYVLAVGQKEEYDIKSLLNIYWQLPFLKITFFKTSVLQFFLTPFGIAGVGFIGGIFILLAVLYYLAGVVRQFIRHHQAKTLLLTSGGMAQMKDEIIDLLQKPAYDITVGFISTAAKPMENLDYLKRDWNILRDEMGFNLQEIDIDGKKEAEVMELLKLKDIIFVEGGNTFYLLKSMRECRFERVMRKLLKEGKVYVGVSAGSIVAGKTIKTAEWIGDENLVKLRNLKGLNFVPFDIVPHYKPEMAEVIKAKMKSKWKRNRRLRVLTDDQAILVQAKEIMLIGEGDAVIV